MSNKRRRCRSKLANHRFAMKRLSEWKDVLEEMEELVVVNPKGRTRSTEENHLIVASIKMILTIYLDFIDKKAFSIHDLNWTFIDNVVATNLGVRQSHVADLRKKYFENGSLDEDIFEIEEIVREE